jgi:dTDP-4-amino-4,6-dideoxygalactose transaminase
MGALSFNGNKIITTSGGGMLVSAEKELTDKAYFLATQARDPARHYQHSQIGYNYRMSNVVAGIGRGQLLHLDEHIRLKKEIYRQYKEAFADIPAITMNPLNVDGEANYWLSCFTIAEGHPVKPEQIMDALEAENIECRPIWKPMHLQPVYEECDYFPHDEGRDVAADIFARGLCLPSDIKNTAEDMERIIGIVRKRISDV